MTFPDNISENITFREATRSATAERLGISNLPDAEQLENMKFIAEHIFEKVRAEVARGKPLVVSSFFRHPLLNREVPGASASSDHMSGSAMDLQRTSRSAYTNADIFNYIRQKLDFDQLIWEKGTDKEPQWVHVSLKRKGNNRRQVLYKR
jgi:zinc D-Ala-D-Ala carboxypeptidase